MTSQLVPEPDLETQVQNEALAAVLEAVMAEKEAACYLRAALKTKQSALVACEVERLQAVAEGVVAAAQGLEQAESHRVEAVRGLQRSGLLAPGLCAEEIDAGQIFDCCNHARRAELELAIAALAGEMAIVSELNLQNEALLRNLLEYTQVAVRLLSGQDTSDTYTQRGSVADPHFSRPLVDSRV